MLLTPSHSSCPQGDSAVIGGPPGPRGAKGDMVSEWVWFRYELGLPWLWERIQWDWPRGPESSAFQNTRTSLTQASDSDF